MPNPRYLDPRLSALLETLRARVHRYVVWDSALAVALVILSAFWIGLALDYVPVQLGGTEMPRLARTILLTVVAVSVAAIVATMLIGRLRRPLPDDSLALLVERHHPRLGGRLVTAVQLNKPGRRGDSHSPRLLQQVHQQAAAAVDEVDPNRVFRWQPLIQKASVVAPLALCAILFLLISPSAFARAASRLTLLSDEPWPRRADLEMVGVELPVVSASDDDNSEPELITFVDRKIRLPRGSDGTLRIRARAEGAELPVVCTVHYQTESGTRMQTNMRRIGRIANGYQAFVVDGPPLTGLSESLTLSVRGLDDRLDNYRIEAAEPPALTDVDLRVRYPEYLRSAGSGVVDLETSYQSGLRIREGSRVDLVATSSLPLGDTEVVVVNDLGAEQTADVFYSEDRRQLQLSIDDFRRATTVSLVPRDRGGISAQAPYRYFLGVVLDQPPELDVRLRGIGTAVTPIARIPVEASVADDYGVNGLTISVSPAASEDSSQMASVSPSLTREGAAESQIDLRDLVAENRLPGIAPGSAINLIVEATDYYDLGAEHVSRSEVFRLQVVTPEELLALMERRELALRSRLEQTIDETRGLRDTLDLLRRTGFESQVIAENADRPNVDQAESVRTRALQVRQLRVQQSSLQANKTAEELSGIAESLDDILREMQNNRVDSVDRQERIGGGVRDPLRQIVAGPLQRLRSQIVDIDSVVEDAPVAKEKTAIAIDTAEDVLLQLTAVLEKMLDLESYNEILDMVRELIKDQNELLDETKSERKKRVLDLFSE